MFSTSGYLRDITCPLFKQGNCERKHCHYKHDDSLKRFNKYSTSKKIHNPLPVYIPTPVSKLKGIAAAGTQSADSKINSLSPASSSKIKCETKTKSEAKIKTKSEATIKTKSEATIPVYKPTPISDLKKSAVKKEIEKESKKPIKITAAISNQTQDQLICDDICDSKVNDSSNNDNNKDCKDQLSKRKIDDSVYEITDKKPRTAHSFSSTSSANAKILPKKPVRESPAVVMHKRFLAQQAAKANLEKDSSKSSHSKTICSSNLLDKEARVQHKPAILKKPVVAYEVSNKVPIKTRQKHLEKYIEELQVFCNQQEAYKRGLETEKHVYDSCSSKTIYFNSSAKALRNIIEEGKKSKSESNKYSNEVKESRSKMAKLGNQIVSHEQILLGPKGGTFSIEKRQTLLETDLTDLELYQMMKKYLLNEQQLVEYGYPRKDPKSRESAIVPVKPELLSWKNDYNTSLRTCSRCKKLFKVNDEGMPIKLETCIFHPGRLWNERFNKSYERKYSCCKNDAGSDGCCSNKYHVVDGYDHPNYCKGYVKTLPKRPPPATGYYGIYGLDCEMCYTTAGLELTKVTVINSKDQIMYETLVKPSNGILDYNSRFSGIKKGDLDNVKTTLADVQTRLLTFFNDQTILIGHSLDSDLKALKIIHETVIDTSQVFPHKKGLPYKRALRNLTSEYLKTIIQADVDGHDSKEDATAAMKLMLWKIREDLKKFKR